MFLPGKPVGPCLRTLDRVQRRARILVAALAAAVVAILPGAGHARSTVGTCQVGDVQISIVDYAFNQADVSISPGDFVCWTNNGTVSHTATSDDSGATFNSGTLAPGDSYRV